jgi:hypothetical protein
MRAMLQFGTKRPFKSMGTNFHQSGAGIGNAEPAQYHKEFTGQ